VKFSETLRNKPKNIFVNYWQIFMRTQASGKNNEEEKRNERCEVNLFHAEEFERVMLMLLLVAAIKIEIFEKYFAIFEQIISILDVHV
jgi:hypothetical protein